MVASVTVQKLILSSKSVPNGLQHNLTTVIGARTVAAMQHIMLIGVYSHLKSATLGTYLGSAGERRRHIRRHAIEDQRTRQRDAAYSGSNDVDVLWSRRCSSTGTTAIVVAWRSGEAAEAVGEAYCV